MNSGSNGNCYYVGNEHEAVLIDAGIPCRQIEQRLDRLGLSLRAVKAIFISHEHSDHIRGIAALARKYQLPVYITPRTRRQLKLPERRFPIYPLSADEPVWIEVDTAPNEARDALLSRCEWFVDQGRSLSVPSAPGLGVDPSVLDQFRVR